MNAFIRWVLKLLIYVVWWIWVLVQKRYMVILFDFHHQKQPNHNLMHDLHFIPSAFIISVHVLYWFMPPFWSWQKGRKMYELMLLCVSYVWWMFKFMVVLNLDIWIDKMFEMFEHFCWWLNIVDIFAFVYQGVFLNFQRKLCPNFQFFIMHMFRGSLLSFIESLL